MIVKILVKCSWLIGGLLCVGNIELELDNMEEEAGVLLSEILESIIIQKIFFIYLLFD